MKCIFVKLYNEDGEVVLTGLTNNPGIERKFVVYFPSDDVMIIGIGPEYINDNYSHHHLALNWMGINRDIVAYSGSWRREKDERIEGGGYVCFEDGHLKFSGTSGGFGFPSSQMFSAQAIQSMLAQTGATCVEAEIKLCAFIDSSENGDFLCID